MSFSCVEPLSMTESCSATDRQTDIMLTTVALWVKHFENNFIQNAIGPIKLLYIICYIKRQFRDAIKHFKFLPKIDQSNSYHICSVLSFSFLFVSWHYLPAWIKDSRDCWGEHISLWRMHRHLSSFIPLFSFYFYFLSAYDETHLLATNILFKRCWSSQLAITPGLLTTQVLC